MRPIILLIAIQLVFSAVKGQVNGLVKDDQGNPVKGATVSLLRAADSGLVKLAASGADGVYSFSGIKEGNYRVKATFVGHKPVFSSPINYSSAAVDIPALVMNKVSGDMKAVVVTASRPLIEVKADKTILNVEGTINAVGSDMLELLRKSPGVMVDKDDNISMSGKNGVQIYIDGRPSPLAGADLANYLKSIQSSQVESIELITNPSAKYEAAGNAGIINIRLKKNKSLGTNGSVNAGWNIGIFPKYNGGLSLNHRNAKVNIFGNYNYNNSLNRNNMKIYRTVLDSIFDQHGPMEMRNESHNFKTGLDYFIDKKSTVGIIVNGNIARPTFSNYSHMAISKQGNGGVNRILIADNKNEMKRDNINLNFNYTYNNPDGRSLVLNADYGFYNLASDQHQPNDYYDASGQVKTSSVVYRMLAPTDINIYSFKADWEQNFKKGKLGYGGKIGYVTSDNDFQRYNVFPSGSQLDKDRSNRFNYKENINAFYVNYNRPLFKGVLIQAGVRIENTNLEGISTGQKKNGGEYQPYDSSFKRHYTDVFPSAAITFNKNPKSQWSLTYSRRIDRPVYQDLNPFEMKLDEYTFQKGNINLRPQYTHSFGLTHTYKFKLNTTVNYSHVNDIFAQLIDTAEGSKAFVSKRNLATQDIVSLNVSYPFQRKNYSVLMNVNTNYSHYTANFGQGRTIDINAFAFRFFAQNSLKFGKNWTAEMMGMYNAPTVLMGTFKVKSMWNIDLGLQKQVFQGKGTVRASVTDIFRTMQFRGTTLFAGQQTTNTFRWESRQFKMSFVYRFGNSQVKAARQRATGTDEENRRVGSGNSGAISQ
ncbi:MAG TPA: TonB-dependent receptor [Chitinophagaceae bacterium]|nr:TonB-dependent receptor [Chitinophagaceae bacterium]